MKWLKKLWHDQNANIVAVEFLVVMAGVLLISSIILVSMSSPLKQLHINRKENITGISRGY